MSGIAGIIHFDGCSVEPGHVEAMTATMHYRGPDGINHWRKGHVALGQCMLRTTPESLEETQPLTNEDQTLVLVMDGRVDNWQELRRELLGKGAVLRTRADAELVLRAYEVWGEDCPDRIVGEYVFFVWDARQQRLFAARDAAGTRHFYYHQGSGWFAFSSEIKGLLTLPIERQLNESRLLDYLVGEFDRDDEVGTFYQGILRMPSGHAMSVTASGLRIWRYWNPANLTEQKFGSLTECTEAFMDQLRVAVQCRLRSIKPVGAMLSGGLDSSTIVALISKEFRGELREPLRTFSLIQEDRENCPDWRCINEILQADPWLQPTILTSTMGDSLGDSIGEAIEQADEPFTVTDGLAYELAYRAAAQADCNVVFDGMAGDQMFYSLDRSLSALLRVGRVSHLPAMLATYKRHGFLIDGLKDLGRVVLREVTPACVHEAWRRHRDAHSLDGGDLQLLHRPVARALVQAHRGANYRGEVALRSESDQAQHSAFFTTGALSFAHERNGLLAAPLGVEPRCPFSDRRMIEFAIRMPLAAKLAMPWYKHVLREGAAGLLPEAVRWRRLLGGNPGWAFFDRLTHRLAATHSAGWSAVSCMNPLDRWVDRNAVATLWVRCDSTSDYESRLQALQLFAASRWLLARGWG